MRLAGAHFSLSAAGGGSAKTEGPNAWPSAAVAELSSVKLRCAKKRNVILPAGAADISTLLTSGGVTVSTTEDA